MHSLRSIQKMFTFVTVGLLISLGAAVPIHAQNTMKFVAHLSGNNEVSPVTTMASGKVTATLEDTTLTITGSFQNLSSSFVASHIHIGIAGKNGGVEIPLTVTQNSGSNSGTFEAAKNTYELTSDQKIALMNRRMYINVHSQMHKAGELRGQLEPEADMYLRAHLSGTNEAPPVKSHGHGAVVAEVVGDSLFLSGSFSELDRELATSVQGGAHLHMAMAGSNASIEIPLVVTQLSNYNSSGKFEVSQNRFKLTTAQKTALKMRKMYINVHSKKYMSGELRGQLVGQTTATFIANLSSNQEVPAFSSSGHGSVVLELNADTLMVSGSFADLESDFNKNIQGGAHLHMGAEPGRNAGIEQDLATNLNSDQKSGVFLASDNTFTLTQAEKEALMARKYYVNIHSMNHPKGSIRGQALGEATAYFITHTYGLHEVQPVSNEGTGALMVEFSDTTANVVGSFQGLGSKLAASLQNGAHFHSGGVDANGSIQIDLNPTTEVNDTSGVFSIQNNHFVLGVGDIENLYYGLLYTNIHSTSHLTGALRGQLQFSPNAYPDTAQIQAPQDSASVLLQGKTADQLVVEWTSASDPDQLATAYVWQLAADANFDSVKMSMNTGDTPSISLTYGAIDTMMMNMGIAAGDSATFYHRVITTDGSADSYSETRMVTFVRGNLTAIPGENSQRQLPDKVTLNQNYPNPFNPSTNISFSLPESKNVRINVYNSLGQKVATLADRKYSAGSHRVNFDASNLSSGVYIYRLHTTKRTIAHKMLLIK